MNADDAPRDDAPERSSSEKPHVEPSKRPWWRVKIPTAVIVTFVGIALSAWLLPAFTRQWDDRKEARALKAQLVEEILVANDSLINGVERPVKELTPDERLATLRRLLRTYDIDGTRIEAKLRIYFSPLLRSYWDRLRESVTGALGVYQQV